MRTISMLLSSFLVIGAVSFAAVSPDVNAQTRASEKKTRKVPALNTKVYEQLARAQAFADNDEPDKAIETLDNVKSKMSSLKSYDTAMMYQFYGFIYFNLEQIDKAYEAFQNAVAQDPIPEAFEQSTLFTLAQLALAQGDYLATVDYLNRWEVINPTDTPPKNYFLKAQAFYQAGQYDDAAQNIDLAITTKEGKGMLPDEGWLILQRAIFFEMKQPEKVRDIIVKLIKLYDQPKYWIQLAGMYGELGLEKEQLAIMETARQMGYVERPADIFNLAQLYYFHKAPYKCAEIMEQAMADGVLEENLRNLKFLGQCFQLAKENDKAVPVMRAAAELSEDGELFAQLSQLLLNIEDFDGAIETAQKAIDKGELNNQGTVHLVLGMAYYNQRQFAKALNQLAEAEEFAQTRNMAKQWQQFVSGEKQSYERLQAELNAG